MPISQVILNGKKFLQERRTVILGISPGNPHYYRLNVLERLFEFARQNSDKVLLFIPDKIHEHNIRAVGSKNPEKSARLQTNCLRNKCNKAIESSGLSDTAYSYVRWTEEVEKCPKYSETNEYVQELYRANEEFRTEIRETTEAFLRNLKHGREKPEEGYKKDKEGGEKTPDLEEGVKYVLKELAFLVAVPSIYERCEKFVFVYHRPWPVLEKFLDGYYDGIVRAAIGYFVRAE